MSVNFVNQKKNSKDACNVWMNNGGKIHTPNLTPLFCSMDAHKHADRHILTALGVKLYQSLNPGILALERTKGKRYHADA